MRRESKTKKEVNGDADATSPLAELIRRMEESLNDGDQLRFTVAEYLRVREALRESEADAVKEIVVRWVEDEKIEPVSAI
jgi:hypothetical protein